MQIVKDKLLTVAFISVILLWLLNWVAGILSLYWTVWWFDNIAHFFGGLTLGLVSFWGFKQIHSFKQEPTLKNIILITVLLAFVAGFGWEVFETLNNISDDFTGETYWQDTIYDLIGVILGGVVSAVFIYKKKLYG